MPPRMRGGRESRLALGLALAAAVLLGASLAGAQNTASLQSRQQTLTTRSHTALLSLYALDSRLVQTRAELEQIHARRDGLRAQQVALRQQLDVVARNLRISQRLLGDRLRTLYETDEPNAIAILLGSSSLDDAVTRLNELDRSARQDSNTVAETQQAKAKLAHLAAVLAARARQLHALEQSAGKTTAALAAARSQRVSYLASLARQRRLTAHELAKLDTRARDVVARAQRVQSRATPSGPPTFVSAQTLTVTATGYSLPGHTATGLPVGFGVVAVDPSVIPLGTRMTIPGYGDGIAADTGSGVSGYAIDLWFPTLAGALAWGRRTVTITLH